MPTADKRGIDKNGARLGPELTLNTPVAGANDTVAGTTNRYYTFFTVPATYDLYHISGLEVLNGTVVNGSFYCGLELVDANLPSGNGSVLLACSAFASQTGTSGVQKLTLITSFPVKGGSIVGAFISTSSASGRYGTTTQGSGNRLKAISFGSGAATFDNTSWAAGTEEPYIKVYGKPIV